MSRLYIFSLEKQKLFLSGPKSKSPFKEVHNLLAVNAAAYNVSLIIKDRPPPAAQAIRLFGHPYPMRSRL